MECKIEGCSSSAFCKGMCQKHYHRAWKHGTPCAIGRACPEETKEHQGAYSSWKAMINRCKYSGYGSVCERWSSKDGFRNFLSDMGDRPDGCSIDRIDYEGDYSPDNCRWATATTQMYNRRALPSATGIRGVNVCSDKRGNSCLRSKITMHGKTYNKYFSIGDIESAKQWRKQKELELYGFAPGGKMVK